MICLPTRTCTICGLIFAAAVAASASASPQDTESPAMTLVVDETHAPQRIAFAHEEIRVKPGPLTLAYPRWIPGAPGSTGPIEQLAALSIRSGDMSLAWKRDPDDVYIIHVDVPDGTDRIAVDFDTLLENTISDHQLLLAWNSTLLYPRDIDKRELTIQPSIVLPVNWRQASSLQVSGQSGERVNFSPLSLERLIDSPVLAGEFFRAVPLSSSWPAELDLTGDSQESVDNADEAHAFTLFAKLIDEDRAMFGFRHWQTMHLLVSQSDALPYDGLEHEDSPYDAIGDAGLSKKDVLERLGWPLLAHEQSHSWDGKYRRPQELYSKPDYQGPERTSLLWVYEGLNEYIGMLLATRAGFNDQAYMRDYLARAAAKFAHEPSRASIALVDTATESGALRAADRGWSLLRRGEDYYDEGALVWLRADTLIREQSRDRSSLESFFRSFFGQHDTGPIVSPYSREEVESSLSTITALDWHRFFQSHIYDVNSKPPTDGLEAAGWRLVYNATPNNEPIHADPTNPISCYAAYSIGIDVKRDGTVADVLPASPAYVAGLGPHMTILAVDGRVYSVDVLNQAIAHPRDGQITVIVRNFDSVESRDIQYAGGLRYPHLERIPNSHDYLSEILSPRSGK
jgi:predicted metalloprotease with PDZ domain